MRKPAFIASALLSALCTSAFAGLGGNLSSVDADRASLKGEVRATSQAGFTVHAITAAGGMVVNEYAAPDGTVFAVSWSGPGVPDLRQVLGSYFPLAQQQAMSRPHYNHHQIRVATPDVVVESRGHARSFVGRAWAPALLPQNFAVADIK